MCLACRGKIVQHGANDVFNASWHGHNTTLIHHCIHILKLWFWSHTDGRHAKPYTGKGIEIQHTEYDIRHTVNSPRIYTWPSSDILLELYTNITIKMCVKHLLHAHMQTRLYWMIYNMYREWASEREMIRRRWVRCHGEGPKCACIKSVRERATKCIKHYAPWTVK